MLLDQGHMVLSYGMRTVYGCMILDMPSMYRVSSIKLMRDEMREKGYEYNVGPFRENTKDVAYSAASARHLKSSASIS